MYNLHTKLEQFFQICGVFVTKYLWRKLLLKTKEADVWLICSRQTSKDVSWCRDDVARATSHTVPFRFLSLIWKAQKPKQLAWTGFSASNQTRFHLQATSVVSMLSTNFCTQLRACECEYYRCLPLEKLVFTPFRTGRFREVDFLNSNLLLKRTTFHSSFTCRIPDKDFPQTPWGCVKVNGHSSETVSGVGLG